MGPWFGTKERCYWQAVSTRKCLLPAYLFEDLFCILGVKISDVLFSTTFARCPSFQNSQILLIVFIFLIRKLAMKVCQRSKVCASCIIYWILSFIWNMNMKGYVVVYEIWIYDLDVMRCFTNFYFFSCAARGLKFWWESLYSSTESNSFPASLNHATSYSDSLCGCFSSLCKHSSCQKCWSQLW